MTHDHYPEDTATAKRILIVEDDVTTRQMLQRHLENHGFRVAVAAHGQEALERLKRGDVDLVVTDVNMPVMNGVEFIYRMRQEPAYQHIPALVMSSDSWISLNALLGEKGVEGVLHKPLDLADLAARIRRSLRIPGEAFGGTP